MAAARLSVEHRRTRGEVTLLLTGEIDLATVGDLRAAAARIMSAPPRRIVLDLAGVTFCDSQGLSALISLSRDLRAAGSQLVLTRVGGFVTRLLDVTGLWAAFECDEHIRQDEHFGRDEHIGQDEHFGS